MGNQDFEVKAYSLRPELFGASKADPFRQETLNRHHIAY
jgi:hypothetical protein